MYEKYENRIQDAPQGWTLENVYDLDSGEPLTDYRKTYNLVAAELRNLGVPLEDYEKP